MLPPRFARPVLAGFQCPCCGADQPYTQTRAVLFITADTGKNGDAVCLSCLETFRIKPPTAAAIKQSRLRWGMAVGVILLGLAGFGLLTWAVPDFPEWIALVLFLVIALAPLPLIEAWATRPMVDFRQIKRRTPPLVPPDLS